MEKTKDKITSWEISKALALSHDKDFFLTEVKNGSTYFPPAQGLLKFDGFAMTRSWAHPCIKIYEIKVSRSDFLRDNKWNLYKQYCNELYFVVPKGLIEKTELPEDVGLIYYNRDGTRQLVTKQKAVWRKIEDPIEVYKYIIYSRLDQDRIPFFNDRKEYAEAYLQDKQDRKYIGSHLGTKMSEQLQEAERKLEQVRDREYQLKVFDAIRDVFQDHKLDPFDWRYGLDWKTQICGNGRRKEPDEKIYQLKIEKFKNDLEEALSSGLTAGDLEDIERSTRVIQRVIEQIREERRKDEHKTDSF